MTLFSRGFQKGCLCKTVPVEDLGNDKTPLDLHVVKFDEVEPEG